tara:strand:- start:105 stop:932 length:828 start_codon:yes stop_codon:yes gene_type:complete
VAFLGPKGTFAEKAAFTLSKLEKLDTPIFLPFNGLRSVIENLANKFCEAAVVPIENSVEGGVTTTLDSLWKNPDLFIRRAVVLPIRHSLIGSGSLDSISEVLSHPQALAQCSGWLNENLPEALQLPTSSTAEAIRMVKGSKFRAAIGPKLQENSNNIHEIAYPINDIKGNCTRFVLLQNERFVQDGDIASIAFSLKSNTPGSLLKALDCIAKSGLNMSRIESRPSKRELGEYVFFVDLELQNNIQNNEEILMKSLKTYCEHIVSFGSYANNELDI